MPRGRDPDLYFSDIFEVSEQDIERHGAFNISLVTDLPLFVDPFLLFNSAKNDYKRLHDDMIRYLRFLRDKSEAGPVDPGLVQSWYRFSEVKQTWLGFCEASNRGRGLGRDFANALNANLGKIFRDFGKERITRGSHIEKLCLIGSGVGRDMISDFTTNLIKDYLLRFTERFARKYIDPAQRQKRWVGRGKFNYDLQCWVRAEYELPVFEGDYVILTPKDILTKDDTWISRSDMIRRFEEIPDAIQDAELRASINNYFLKVLPKDPEPKSDERQRAVLDTLYTFPAIIDYYIRIKEDTGDEAVAHSAFQVSESDRLYVKQFGHLARLLSQLTGFYALPGNTREEARQRIDYFKDFIENKGGHRLLYDATGQPIRKESDLQLMFLLVWYGTPSDVSREVNDGRGPADFKVSRGSPDKSLVEFKLASNSQLKRNLRSQVETYQKASGAHTGLKVVIFFTQAEHIKVQRILQELDLLSAPNVILIDARLDNKPSGSKA
jgi:hypothetical protein